MPLTLTQTLWLLISSQVGTAAASYAVPSSSPSGATALDPAPVALSFEFFTFPSYFTNVTATHTCLENFQTLTGTWPRIRIGGTTQDRATYDASTPDYVVYTVPAPSDAPTTLTYGKSFMTLAGAYGGNVVLGLNRGYGNITNTIAAAKVAKSEMSNLLALELGNEPDYWTAAADPIVTDGTWTPADDDASQNNWDIQVGEALDSKNIIQAGVYDHTLPTWGITQLIDTENSTVKEYVYDYSHHHYTGGDLSPLMSHSNIVGVVGGFSSDVGAATAVGKQYVFGETNSVAGGGAATVSPTFGAALWTMDYVLRAALTNIQRSYFHHGTIGSCYYCWWGRSDMGAPYYGAYAATAAMAGGATISALDNGDTAYAVYVIYDSSENPLRAVLYNSNYYNGSGTRSSESFQLTGLSGSSVTAKRLTAASALSRVDQGSNPTFGKQTFANETCEIQGTAEYETTTVSGGSATFSLYASEALVVYL